MMRDYASRPGGRNRPSSIRQVRRYQPRNGTVKTTDHSGTGRKALVVSGALGLLSMLVLSSDSDNLEKHLAHDFAPEQTPFTAFVDQYHLSITAAAEKYGLPAELIASVLQTENLGRSYKNDLDDKLGSFVGKNVSIGPMQIRPSVAMSLDRMATGKTKGNIGDYLTLLQNPEENIDYGARFLAHLRDGMYPGTHAEQLLQDPEALAMLASQYNTGEQRRPQVNCNGWFSAGNIASMPKSVQRTGAEDVRHRAFERMDSALFNPRSYSQRHCSGDLGLIHRYKR